MQTLKDEILLEPFFKEVDENDVDALLQDTSAQLQGMEESRGDEFRALVRYRLLLMMYFLSQYVFLFSQLIV